MSTLENLKTYERVLAVLAKYGFADALAQGAVLRVEIAGGGVNGAFTRYFFITLKNKIS